MSLPLNLGDPLNRFNLGLFFKLDLIGKERNVETMRRIFTSIVLNFPEHSAVSILLLVEHSFYV